MSFPEANCCQTYTKGIVDSNGGIKRTFFIYLNKKKFRHGRSGEQSDQGIEPWKLHVPEEET